MILSHPSVSNEEVALLLKSAQKVFDYIEWKTIFSDVKLFWFGPVLTNWLVSMYSILYAKHIDTLQYIIIFFTLKEAKDKISLSHHFSLIFLLKCGVEKKDLILYHCNWVDVLRWTRHNEDNRVGLIRWCSGVTFHGDRFHAFFCPSYFCKIFPEGLCTF